MNKKHWSVCLIFLMSCIGYQATLAVKSIDITHKLKKDQATTTHKFKPKTLKINRIIYKNQQNALLFLKTYDAKRYKIPASYTKHLKKQYLQRHYLPWTHPYKVIKRKDIYRLEKNIIAQYLQKPGWDENRYPHSKKWIQQLADNIDLKKYPNQEVKAIVIHPSNLRLMPTIKPDFEDAQIPGQGYPFDNFQTSRLRANAPVFIVHTTKDRAWHLIITPSGAIGWVENKSIALVDKEFVKNWRRQSYVAPVKDGVSIASHDQFYFLSRIGEIYPVIKKEKNGYLIQVAVKKSDGYATLKMVFLDNPEIKAWPLAASSKNIATLANQFLGTPYGWGDLYGYRDCSTTTRDLYAPFAIWLPRNSTSQANSLKSIDLSKLDNQAKQKLIREDGIPFFTLIWMQGHITVYVGQKNHDAFILHSPWGLHLNKNPITQKGGRVVIGRAVIDPINLGQGNFPLADTRLNQAGKLLFVVPAKHLELEKE